MNVLFKGILYNYHSNAIVNYFLLKYLKQIDDVTIFYESSTFLPVNLKFDEPKLQLQEYTGTEKIDIIFQSSFPYVYRPSDTPTIMFVTNEKDFLQKEFFNYSVNKMLENDKLFFLTPSAKSQQAFLNESKDFAKKVFVLPHGIDPAVFYKISRPNNNKYTILHVSALSQNKNLPLILDAVRDLDVNLIVKAQKDIYKFNTNLSMYPNVKLITESLSFKEMNELFNSCDAYVSAGSLEAFDIPIVEAAYLGLDVFCNKESPQNKLVPKSMQFSNSNQLKKLIQQKTKHKTFVSDSYFYKNIAKIFYSDILSKIVL